MIVFCAFIVALAYGLDALISSGLRRVATSKFGSMNRVMTGRANATIVVNGSSRALMHYDPRVIRDLTGHRTYNLGMNGIQIDVQRAILEAYLAHHEQPKLVIQNLEAFSLEATGPGEIHDPGAYLPYLGDTNLYHSLRRIDPAVWKWKNLPLYGYVVEDMNFTWIAGLLGWLGISSREDYFDGFSPRFATWTGDFERFRASIPVGIHYPIQRRGVEALAQIIELCRRRGIRLLLVYSPEYIEMQALERNRGQIFSRFRELSARFDVPLWDFSASSLSREKALFYNSQHLNAGGATTFSQQLAQKLIESGLIASPAVAGN